MPTMHVGAKTLEVDHDQAAADAAKEGPLALRTLRLAAASDLGYPKNMAQQKDITGRPWDRIQGETVPAYRAFIGYLELGAARSIAKALTKAGGKPGQIRQWERWSQRNNWVQRAAAYDTDQLHDRIAGRKMVTELAKQQIHDEIVDMVRELRDLSVGKMRSGQRSVRLSRDGKPIMVPVVDPNTGEITEVAATEELVPPKTRAQILQHLLAVAGVQSPRRIEHSGVDGEPLGIDLRSELRSMDPELFGALAGLLGIAVEPGDHES